MGKKKTALKQAPKQEKAPEKTPEQIAQEQAAVQKERTERSNRVATELSKLLSDNKCILDVKIIVGQTGNEPLLRVVAN